MSVPSQAHIETWFVEFSPKRILEMRGNDGLDLLQRISTNDLTRLATGSWAQTVLTNEKGRMIDVLWVGRIQKDMLYLLGGTDPERSKTWIEKFIIMEDAQVSFSNGSYKDFVVVNSEILSNIPLMRFEERWGGTSLLHLLAGEMDGDAAVKLLTERNIVRRSLQEFEDYRILAGIPQAGYEITPEYNPLEAGLERLVSWTKGCYIGQEVIARLDTYKKVQKRLVKFSLADKVVPLPAQIIGSTGEVGAITSVTSDAPFAGLGYLATKQIEVGGPLFVSAGDTKVQVTVEE